MASPVPQAVDQSNILGIRLLAPTLASTAADSFKRQYTETKARCSYYPRAVHVLHRGNRCRCARQLYHDNRVQRFLSVSLVLVSSVVAAGRAKAVVTPSTMHHTCLSATLQRRAISLSGARGALGTGGRRGVVVARRRRSLYVPSRSGWPLPLVLSAAILEFLTTPQSFTAMPVEGSRPATGREAHSNTHTL